MAANHRSRLLRWILATPLAVLTVLPVGAADLRSQRGGHTLGPALAQLPAQTEQPIPADITALEQTAEGFYERGEYQKALEVMQKVMIWIDGNLPHLHSYRAKSLSNLGILLSKVGRRQEALAPTEEALKLYRELAKTNPAFQPDLARSLNNLGYLQLQLDQPEIARSAYEESIAILRPLTAGNPAFQEDLQRSLNNLEELNRQEGIRTKTLSVVSPTDQTYLPKGDPDTFLRRSVVRLRPTFAGQNPGIGLGTGFVVRLQGDRAWIVTALHVVLANDDRRPPVKLEAELYAGTLPEGLVHPRLDVVLPPSQDQDKSGEDLIILEVRGLPADVQPLPLTTVPPTGILKVVGHPSDKPAWAVATFPVLKSTERQLVLDGKLMPGASGSPVLNGAGQVLGLVYEISTFEKQDINLVFAYRTQAIQSKLR